MKKLLTILVAMILLCSLALAESADLIGEWHLSNVEVNGVSVNPAMMGMDMIFIFNEDGTVDASMIYPGEEPDAQTGVWAAVEGGVEITINDNPVVIDFDGEHLRLAQEDGTMEFSRDVAAVVLPSVVAAEGPEAFEGTWTLSQVSMMGMMVPAALTQATGSLVVDGAQVTITTAALGEESSGEMLGEFADGVLVLAEDVPSDATNQQLALMDDGSVALRILNTEDNSELMSMYFVKAE